MHNVFLISHQYRLLWHKVV